MEADTIRQRIQEYANIRLNAKDDPIAQVEAALFIEEVFGLSLTDADMNEASLGTQEAMVAFVLAKLGVK